MAPRSNISAQQAGHPAQAAWPAAEVDQYGRPIDPRWAQQAAAQQGQGYAPQGYQGEVPQTGNGYPEQQGYATHGYAPQHGYQGQPEYPTAPPQHFAEPYAPHQAYAQNGYPGQAGAPQQQPQSFSDAYAQASAHNARQSAQGQYEQFNPQPTHQGQGYDHFEPQQQADAHAYGAQPAQHGYYDPRQAYEPTLPSAVTAPPSGFGAQHGHHPHELQAHDHLAHDPAAHGGHPQSDPRSWDLSHYPPQGGHGTPMAYPADPHAGHHDPRYMQPTHAGWPQQPAPPQTYADPGYDAPHQQHFGHGAQPQPTLGAQVAPAQGYGAAHAEGEADDGEDAEAPRRPKAMLVVGALIGAIALGGGLAYGYKRFVATAGVAKVPVVSAPKAPTRVAPTDPGGKDWPHTDKKFPNRHDEKGGAPQTGQVPPAAPQTPVDAEAPRKVTTVIVNKDGSITPAAAAPAPPPPPVMQSGVPGMVIEGVNPPQPRPELRGAAAPERAATPPVTPVQKAPAQPKVADLPLPKVKNEARPDAATPPVPKKKPAVRDDLVSQQQTGAPAAPTSAVPGANGHVVVLTSRKSREDALKSFADLQQKYGEVIGNRPMDVREVNLGEKGVWFRSIVGPPGSREAARALCKQLTEQGFKDCFTMAY